jgi:hypothetical protein
LQVNPALQSWSVLQSWAEARAGTDTAKRPVASHKLRVSKFVTKVSSRGHSRPRPGAEQVSCQLKVLIFAQFLAGFCAELSRL